MMNKLIKELHNLACRIDMEQHPDAIPDGERIQQKFAELIVRECANQCDLLLDHKISSEWARGTHDCSKAIKKHFGVEE